MPSALPCRFASPITSLGNVVMMNIDRTLHCLFPSCYCLMPIASCLILIKHTALLELDQIAPIDHVGRLDRFRARILRRDLIERCLQRRIGNFQAPLKSGNFGLVCRIEYLGVGNPQIFAEDLINKLSISVNNF